MGQDGSVEIKSMIRPSCLSTEAHSRPVKSGKFSGESLLLTALIPQFGDPLSALPEWVLALFNTITAMTWNRRNLNRTRHDRHLARAVMVDGYREFIPLLEVSR